jgi:two-component system nitrogen regulation sensor histidine kinase NtrY
MVSEILLHTRSRYYLISFLVVSLIAAGILFAESRIVPAVVLFLAGLLSAGMILRLFDVINQTIACFFDALRNDDTTLQFPVNIKNKSFSILYDSMNRLNKHFQDIRRQYEFNETYYRTLIQHASSGLLVLNQNNEVELINEAACRYSGISTETTNFKLLAIKNPPFYEAICDLQPGEDITYKSILGNSYQILLFRATYFKRNELNLKLVSIHDIRQELESREIESYRKLISVLTHEIMNLISPLTAVSKSLYTMYHPGNQSVDLKDLDESVLKTTLNGLQIIEDQSNGLINFINNYRKISRIPQPEIIPFDVEEWIEQLQIVYADKLKENNISFEISADKRLKNIAADKKLLNQVIINLVNNAIEALMVKEIDRKISITILPVPHNRTWIKISNNGPSIPPDMQERIFVPFFTTKKNGSGIGLSISQEIMKLHKGSLLVLPASDETTSFVMEL